MWKGGISKAESDKKWAQSEAGVKSHNKARAKYNQENKVKVAQQKKKWHKKSLETNPHYKVKRNLSNQIWCRLKRQRDGIKKGSINEYLPYTVEELMSHLESKFLPKMTWGNYGAWHIDHIIPDSNFTYSKMSDDGFIKSWSLENLQPLWAKDNLSKGNKH